jgi:hypothetical protein
MILIKIDTHRISFIELMPHCVGILDVADGNGKEVHNKLNLNFKK